MVKTKFIIMLNVFLLVITSFIMPGCHKSKTQDPPATIPVTPPPTVPLPDTVFTNGVNLQPSYYNGGNVNFGWTLMAQNSKIKTVRIEIESFVNINVVRSWISEAKTNGYNVIATYHKATVLGSDDANELIIAANWWKNNYNLLSQAGTFTINLMNEWGSHNISSDSYATAYNNAISIVRQVYNGFIIIDCPGWGQGTTVAANAVKGTGGGVKISDTRIILSAHIYPNGWNQAKNHFVQVSDLDDLASAGRTCIIGEFGNAPAGSVDWAGVVNYAKSKGWAILGWAWNGDGGTMNLVTPQWSSNATATTFTASPYFNTIYSLL